MAIRNMSRRGRALTAVGAGCVAAGVLAASAASLGALEVNNLGSTATVVAACQSSGLDLTPWGSLDYSGVSLATTPTESEGSTFNITGVTLTGIGNTCSGQSYKLVLASSTGASLVEKTGTVTATPSIVISWATDVDSKLVDQAILTIYE